MEFGPIVMVEDDADEIEIFQYILRELNIQIELITFDNTTAAKDFLLTYPQKPFLIICDVNLPGQNGLDFKKEIDEDPELKRKSIPFIFFSTSCDQSAINEAYSRFSLQGYFQKADTIAGLKQSWRIILDYWLSCKHPELPAPIAIHERI